MTSAPMRAGAPIILMAFAALLAGCKEPPPKVPEPRLVRAEQVALEVKELRSTYSGEVRARYESALAFRVGGKIIAREIEVGQTVKKGQVLARLDPSDTRLSAEAARSQLAAVQAEHEQAKLDLARYAKLLEGKVVSQADFDRRQNNFNAVQARLEQARSQLQVSQNQFAYTTLAADNDGVITAVAAEVGQVVASGQTVFRLARTEEKEVVISVAENRLDEVQDANETSISLWALPDRNFKGNVREVSPGVEALTRTYTVKVAIADATPQVQLGMTANVAFSRRTPTKVVTLPMTALFSKDNESAVWIVDPQSGTVKLKPVKVVAYRDNFVVISAGLDDGDTVITAGVHKVDPAMKVRVAVAR